MDLMNICVTEDITILQAMEQLDNVATKILFVHRDGRLLASLTDGDIRRWILSNGKLEAQVKSVANYTPKFLKEHEIDNAFSFIAKHKIESVPIVNDDFIIKDVIFWSDRFVTKKKDKLGIPVVMMAGGKGTRLYPYTKILPKPLIPIGETPIAERIINKFREYDCKDFYLIVNHKKNMIKAYFNEIGKNYNIYFIEEEKPLGTGGGLSLLKGKINSTFILTNCDIIINEDFSKIYKLHKENKNSITMVCSLKTFKIPYGVVEIGKEGNIENMKEKPELSFFTNTGCYIVEPEVIEGLEDGKEIGFPDIVKRYQDAGNKVGVYPIGEKAWLDMGQMDELERMRSELEQEIN